LSGMNSLEQVKENLAAAEKTTQLTLHELTLVSQAAQLYSKSGFIGCTKCRYCAHCPQTVAIPEVLSLLNEWSAAKRQGLNTQDELKQKYQTTVPTAKWASNCQKCGQCEQRCPQHLPIPKLLSEASSVFE
jgi:predicted aldo/keto reductase-like oxidoreductase